MLTNNILNGNKNQNDMKIEHTQGDWIKTSDGEANFSGISANGKWLMRIQQNGELSVQEHDCNTNLIASAPELLRVLQVILNLYTLTNYPSVRAILEAKAIMKKATT